MDENIKNRKLEIRKRLIKTFLITLISFILAYKTAVDGVPCVIPIIDSIMFFILKLDENVRGFILVMMLLFFDSLPGISLVIGRLKIDAIMEESKKLKEEEIKYTAKRTFEKQQPLVENIKVRFEALPRDKQMEILNFIKDESENLQDEIYSEIRTLSKESLEFLQSEVENILFPSFVEDSKNSYSRKRTI